MLDNSRAADICAVAGSTGSGKSTYVKRQLRGRTRVLVFDVKAEYGSLPGFRIFRSCPELARALRRMKHCRAALVPSSRDDFELFCRIAFAWGNCTVVVEESAAYTNPGKAPPAWHRVLSQGRALGLRVFGITQRPAESDKTIWGNATRIWCGWMARADDRKAVAKELDIPAEKVGALRRLDYLEKDLAAGAIKAGRLKF